MNAIASRVWKWRTKPPSAPDPAVRVPRFWPSPSRLFLKVFFWFWLTALVVLAMLVVSVVQRSRTAPHPVEPPDLVAGVAPVLADAAVHAYEARGAAGYRQFCRVIIGNQNRTLYLVDWQGLDVLGRRLPENVQAIVSASRGQHHPLLQFGFRSKVTAYETYSPGGRPYVIALSIPRINDSTLPDELGGAFIPAVLVSVTLLCLALARHIAGPVTALSAIAQRVSLGDLSARAPESATKRHDELASLGTDFNEMIERIQTLMNAHQELLASVSHELRSPLSRLNLSLALLNKAGNPTQTTIIARMEQDVSRVDGLMTQLLTLSRLDSGIAGDGRTEVDLCLLLQEVVADCNFEAQASGKSVYGDLASPATLSCADAEALRSACENVVRNAVRFTAPGTAVRVRLAFEDDGQEATITVEDSGPGVPDQHLQKIFHPFFRIDRNERTHEGMGLGLAIAARAIHLHRGSISAFNRRPHGLKVEVRLPKANNP